MNESLRDEMLSNLKNISRYLKENPEERTKLLIDSGIIDSTGQYRFPYRPPVYRGWYFFCPCWVDAESQEIHSRGFWGNVLFPLAYGYHHIAVWILFMVGYHVTDDGIPIKVTDPEFYIDQWDKDYR